MPKKLTIAGVEAQLRKWDGNLAAVGRAFGVTRSAVANYITAHPQLAPVRDEARESVKDDVESELFRQAKSGEGWAVCFFLKTQAKDRGYTEQMPELAELRVLYQQLLARLGAVEGAGDAGRTDGDGG